MTSFFFIATAACLLLTIYDFAYCKILNIVTIPFFVMGFYLSFPGTPLLWMSSVLLVSAWSYGWIGGGDAKLWLGLVWVTAYFLGDMAVYAMFFVQVLTGALQIVARSLTQKNRFGIKSAGGWRALVYMVLVSFYSSYGWQFSV